MPTSFSDELIAQCILRMRESEERIVKCLNELNEQELWQRPNAQLSAVANLVLHLCGNIRQYTISSLGGTTDVRDRKLEFSANGGHSTDELLNLFTVTINEATSVIQDLSEQELVRERMVQGFKLTGIGILIHVTEHLSYHTGQIAFYTKLLKAKDLGFYAGLNLDIKNS
jgi:uncharacterized damage-inducible protein DinB